MLEKRVPTILELNWNQRLGHKKTNFNICHHMLTSSTQLQNWSFHVVERTRTSSKCQKMKNARAKRAKILFFIVKYANLWGFCCRRRRGCLSSLFFQTQPIKFLIYSVAVAVPIVDGKTPYCSVQRLRFPPIASVCILTLPVYCFPQFRFLCVHLTSFV